MASYEDYYNLFSRGRTPRPEPVPEVDVLGDVAGYEEPERPSFWENLRERGWQGWPSVLSDIVGLTPEQPEVARQPEPAEEEEGWGWQGWPHALETIGHYPIRAVEKAASYSPVWETGVAETLRPALTPWVPEPDPEREVDLTQTAEAVRRGDASFADLTAQAAFPKEAELQPEPEWLQALRTTPTIPGRDVIADIIQRPGVIGRPAARLGTSVAIDPVLGFLRVGRAIPGLARAASTYFAGVMGVGTIQAGEQAARILQEEGYTPEAAEMLVETALSALVTKGAFSHARGRAPSAQEIATEARRLQTPDIGARGRQEALRGAREERADVLAAERDIAEGELRSLDAILKQTRAARRTLEEEAAREAPRPARAPEALEADVADFAARQGQVRISDVVNEFGVRKFKAQKLLQGLEREGRLSSPDRQGFRQAVRERPAEARPEPTRAPKPAPAYATVPGGVETMLEERGVVPRDRGEPMKLVPEERFAAKGEPPKGPEYERREWEASAAKYPEKTEAPHPEVREWVEVVPQEVEGISDYVLRRDGEAVARAMVIGDEIGLVVKKPGSGSPRKLYRRLAHEKIGSDEGFFTPAGAEARWKRTPKEADLRALREADQEALRAETEWYGEQDMPGRSRALSPTEFAEGVRQLESGTKEVYYGEGQAILDVLRREAPREAREPREAAAVRKDRPLGEVRPEADRGRLPEGPRRAPAPAKGRKFYSVAGREVEAKAKPTPPKQPFFSKLRQVISNFRQKAGSTWDYRRFLTRTKSGVVGEEMKWTGALDWLKNPNSEAGQRYAETMRKKYGEGWAGKMTEWEKGQHEKLKRHITTEEFDRFLAENDVQIHEVVKGGEGTKFGRWQLPGAKEGTYRELLLTLGEKPGERARLEGLEKELRRLERENTELADGVEFTETQQKRYHENDAKMRELRQQLVAPDRAAFTGGHWEEPNVLAHVRFNERVGPKGERILFVEEVQSDWHQTGKREGYRRADTRAEEPMVAVDKGGFYEVSTERGEFVSNVTRGDGGTSPAAAIAEARRRSREEPMRAGAAKGVPPAPFAGATKSPWHEMAMRRMVRWAAENGFDRIAWIDGAETIKRYDLSKQISRLEWAKAGKDKVTLDAYDHENNRVIQTHKTLEELPGIVPKEVADRIVSKFTAGEEVGELSGLDLKIGGEWAKNLYDVMVPSFMKKFGKQWGAKVEETPIKTEVDKESRQRRWEELTDEQQAAMGPEDLEIRTAKAELPFQSLDITPDMRRSVVEKGVPKFAVKKKAEPPKPKPKPGVTEKSVKAAFKGAKVDKAAGGWRVTMKDGRTVYVLEAGHIALDLPAFRESYKREPTATETAVGVFEGTDAYVGVPLGGIIRLAKGRATGETLQHEAFHAAVNMALTPKEVAFLRARFGGDGWEEKAAKAYEKWDGVAEAPLFKKVKAYFSRLWKGMGEPTVEQAFEAIREGRPYEPQLQARAGRARAGKAYAVEGTPPELETPPQPRRKQTKPEAVPEGAVRGVALAPEAKTDALLRQIQNEFLRMNRQQQGIEKAKGPVKEEMDVSSFETTFSGRTEDKLLTFREEYWEPTKKEMLKSEVSPEDLGNYLYAKHAPDRNARMRRINPDLGDAGSGRTDAWSAGMLRRLKGEGKTQALERMAQRVYAALKYQRDLMVESGLESRETVDTWLDAFGERYVPLKTHEVDQGMVGTGRGFDIWGKETKAATGRQTQAGNPLASALAQVEQTILRAEKNRVGQAMLRLVEENPDPNLWTVDVMPEKPGLNKKTGMVEWKKDPLYRFSDDVLAVKRDGKVHLIHIKGDPLLARAMKNLSPNDAGKIVQWAGTLNRVYSSIVTTYAPEFMMTNPARDIQTALLHLAKDVSAKEVRRALRQTPKAIRGMYQLQRNAKAQGEWVDLARRFRRSGGKTGYVGMLEGPAEKMATLMRDVKTSGPGGKAAAARVLKQAAKWVEDANTAMENGIRLSAFEVLTRPKSKGGAGLSDQKAAAIAKDLTVNFNRKGEVGRFMNSFYAFFNASVQGTDRAVRHLKTKTGQKQMATIIAIAATMDTINRAIAGDADDDGVNDYDAIKDFVKERNFIIMRGGGKEPITIPLPYGYNVMHAFGRNMSAVSSGNKTLMAGLKDFITVAQGAFNPLGGEASWIQRAFPTLADPAVQIAMNENFAGNPLRPAQPQFGAEKPYSQLYFSTVSPQSKWIAQTLNEVTGGDVVTSGAIDISPEVIDHIMAFIGGGAGKFGGQVMGIADHLWKGELPSVRKTPFLRRFLYQEHPAAVGIRYRENMDELKQLKARKKHYTEQGLKEKLATLPREMLAAIVLTDRIEKLIRKMKKEGAPFDDPVIQKLKTKANKIIEVARRKAEQRGR